MRTCSITDCDKKHKGRGWCRLHLDRWKRNGDPLIRKDITHNMTNTPEYRAWCHMKERCTNPKAKSYSDYGARGITVSSEWMESFEQFYKDMGKRPTAKHSIDRINNDGNYEPSNCRWATALQQVMNRRINGNNTSGYKGVSFDKRRNRWYSQTNVDYRHVFFGYFDTAEAAHEAYLVGVANR